VLDLLNARVFGRDPAPANVFLYGNRGSGKSHLIRMFLHACAMAVPGFKYVLVRRNMPDLHKNHLIHVGKELRALGGDYHQNNHQANYANGSIGFYSQCEMEHDVEKIVGAEAAVLFVDEAPQIKWDFLRMLGPSLRVAKGPNGEVPYRTLVIYGGNPIGESIEELFRYFVDHNVEADADPEYDPSDFLGVEMTRADNPSIDEAEYRKQFAGLPAHYRKAWLDGVRMEARTMFDIRRTKDGQPYHYIQELPTIDGTPLLQVPWVQVYRAFDMGFFPDPAVCLWIVVVGRRVIVVKEGTWFRRIAKDLAADILTDTRELIRDTPIAMTYADPSIDWKTGSDAVTVRDTLELAGMPIECSVNDRVLYADAIHSLLGEEVEPGVPRLQIYEPGCPMLSKYLPKMRWDEANPRKMANHKFDHWIVALAYFAISSGVLSNTEQSSHVETPVWMTWMNEGRGQRSRGTRR
jgi:hypothetical protein